MAVREHLDYAEKVRTQRRTRVVTALFIAAFTAYLGALWYLQVIQGKTYRLMATENVLRTVEVPAYRGNIRDRRGRILVSNRLAFNVLADRETITRRGASGHRPPAPPGEAHRPGRGCDPAASGQPGGTPA